MDYAWKGDKRYIIIRELIEPETNDIDLISKIALFKDLWYFDFNAIFNVEKGDYVIFFATTITNYTMNITWTGDDGQIEKKSFEIDNTVSKNNKKNISFKSKGKAHINCREIDTIKLGKAVLFLLCIPTYYWNKVIDKIIFVEDIQIINFFC